MEGFTSPLQVKNVFNKDLKKYSDIKSIFNKDFKRYFDIKSSIPDRVKSLELDKNKGSELLRASQEGQSNVVQSLLEEGSDVNQQTEYGVTALMIASVKGNLHMIELLLNHGAQVDLLNKDGSSALMLASLYGHTEVLQVLLQNGVQVDLQDNDGRSALMCGSGNGHTDAIQVLLQNGAQVDLQDKDGRSAIMFACAMGHTTAIQKLLKKVAQVDLQDNDGRSALMLASAEGHAEDIQVLLQNRAQVDLQDNHGKSALMCASVMGHTVATQMLLQNGAQVNLQDNNGKSALMFASGNGHTKATQQLLQDRAQVDLQDDDGKSSLMLASENGRTEAIQVLLQNGAQVDLQDNDGKSALMIGSGNGHTEATQALLQNGAQIDLQDNNGASALIFGSGNGHVEVVQVLLQNEAQVNLQDMDRWTALIYASIEGHVEAVQVLLQNGAHVDKQDNDGRSALMLASENGHTEAIQVLLQNGAQLDLETPKGLYVLSLASESGHDEAVDILLKHGSMMHGHFKKDNTDENRIVESLCVEERMLPVGYVKAGGTNLYQVYLPDDCLVGVEIHEVKDLSLQPQLKDNQILSTPVVRITSHSQNFSKKPAIITLSHSLAKSQSEVMRMAPVCSNTDDQISDWKLMNSPDCVLEDNYIRFSTFQFGTFVAISTIPYPSSSITLQPNVGGTLHIPELPGFQLDVPNASVSHLQEEVTVCCTVHFCDKPHNASDVHAPASACIQLEPHDMEFNHPVQITIPIPDYEKIKELFSDVKLELWCSPVSQDSKEFPTQWEHMKEVSIYLDNPGNGTLARFEVSHFSWKEFLYKMLGAPLQLFGLGAAMTYSHKNIKFQVFVSDPYVNTGEVGLTVIFGEATTPPSNSHLVASGYHSMRLGDLYINIELKSHFEIDGESWRWKVIDDFTDCFMEQLQFLLKLGSTSLQPHLHLGNIIFTQLEYENTYQLVTPQTTNTLPPKSPPINLPPENSAELLIKVREKLVLALKSETTWVAGEMKLLGWLSDGDYEDITSQKSLRNKEDKANIMVDALIDRVKLNNNNFAKFIGILKGKSVCFDDIICILTPGLQHEQ